MLNIKTGLTRTGSIIEFPEESKIANNDKKLQIKAENDPVDSCDNVYEARVTVYMGENQLCADGCLVKNRIYCYDSNEYLDSKYFKSNDYCTFVDKVFLSSSDYIVFHKEKNYRDESDFFIYAIFNQGDKLEAVFDHYIVSKNKCKIWKWAKKRRYFKRK